MDSSTRVVSEGAGGAILAEQLTLSQPGETGYAHHITTGTPGFSDLHIVHMALVYQFLSVISL